MNKNRIKYDPINKYEIKTRHKYDTTRIKYDINKYEARNNMKDFKYES